jgi:uncharacterized protein YjbI with pentapeptide repeats
MPVDPGNNLNFKFPLIGESILKSVKRLNNQDVDMNEQMKSLPQSFNSCFQEIKNRVNGLYALSYINEDSENEDCESNTMAVLVDSGLIKDLLLGRETHYCDDIASIFDSQKAGDIHVYVTAGGVRDIWDIAQYYKDENFADAIIKELLSKITVCLIDADVVEDACTYSLPNFDSALQLACLQRYKLDAIVTSCPELFIGEKLEFEEEGYTIITPAAFDLWMYGDKKVCEKSSVIQRKLSSIESSYTEGDTEVEKCDLRIQDISIEHFEVYSAQEEASVADMTFWFYKDDKFHKQFCVSVEGQGPIHALCTALDEGLSQQGFNYDYSLYSTELRNVSPGANSGVLATIVLECDGAHYVGRFLHRDTIKSAFYAYVDAIKNLVVNNSVVNSVKSITISNSLPERRRSHDSDSKAMSESVRQSIEAGKTDFERMKASYLHCLNQNWTGASFDYSELDEIYVDDSSLRETSFTYAHMNRSVVRGSNFDSFSARSSSWQKASFDAVSIVGADLFHANFEQSSLRSANLSFSKLNKSNFKRSHFIDCDLQGVDLDNSLMKGCLFHRVNLSRSTLTEVDFQDSILYFVMLLSSNLGESDFSGATLNRVVLHKANLAGSSFKGADLSGIQIAYSNLQGTDFQGANLTGVNMEGCDLRGAKIDNSNFSGANLIGVKFDKNVSLASVNLENAVWTDGQTLS